MATLSSDSGSVPAAPTGESTMIVATSSTPEISSTIGPLGSTEAITGDTSTTPTAATIALPGDPSAITTSAISQAPVDPSLASTISILDTLSSEPASSTSVPTTAYSSSSLFVTEPTPTPAQTTPSIYSTTSPSAFDSGSTAYVVPPSSFYSSSSSSYTPVTGNPYSSSFVAYTTSPDLYQTSAQSTSNTEFSGTTTQSIESVFPLTVISPSASSSSSASVSPQITQHRRGASLSTGAKIGIGVGVGVVVVAALAIILIVIDIRRRHRRTNQPPEQEPIVPYFDSPESDGAGSKHVSQSKSPPTDRQELETHASDYSAPTGRTPIDDLYPVPGVATRLVPRNRRMEQQGMQVAETPGVPMRYSPRPQATPLHPMDPTELEEERRLQTSPYEMRSARTPRPGPTSRRPIPLQPPPAPRTPHEFTIDAGFMSAERPLQIANPDLEPPSRSATPYGQPMRMNSRGSAYEEEIRRWNRGQLNLRRQEIVRSTEGERRYEER